ncbi:50S ribosomal protein L4 [Pelagibacterales bacterium SAG-MED31]|nr:50S ribosomal protein L4 [Pelagibacterales bacterium SAG-MED31]
MKKQIVNLENKKIKDFEINLNIFGIKLLPDIIHQYIRYQNAKSRQGTHKTKSRSEVNGKAKKPFSQKGTGNARQGSSKPPHFRGGATSMGPVPRDHSFTLNKKEKKIALKSALSSKLLEDNIIFLDTLEVKTHKTKDLVSKLENFDFNTALFVYGEEKINDNFKKASSNIPHVSLLSCSGINVKDLISNHKIFIDEKSINHITKRLS